MNHIVCIGLYSYKNKTKKTLNLIKLWELNPICRKCRRQQKTLNSIMKKQINGRIAKLTWFLQQWFFVKIMELFWLQEFKRIINKCKALKLPHELLLCVYNINFLTSIIALNTLHKIYSFMWSTLLIWDPQSQGLYFIHCCCIPIYHGSWFM